MGSRNQLHRRKSGSTAGIVYGMGPRHRRLLELPAQRALLTRVLSSVNRRVLHERHINVR